MDDITAAAATPVSEQSSYRGSNLISWSEAQSADFGLRPVLARHRLHQLDLFTDSALLDLLENYPRDRLQAFTMGTDVLNRKDWQPVDTAGVSGRDLLTAVGNGRLWFNILQVHLVDRRYRDLIDELYAELSEQCPTFGPLKKNGTLIISSPTALVYYHADAQPNFLWQVRGSKRVWVYPPGDKALVSQDLMEDIFASFADEEVPYEFEFDRKATTFDLMPGDVLSWSQNAPHRVTNLQGVNVSLSTVHETKDSDRRKLVYCANRLFRRSYHIPSRSTKETGALSYVKRLAYRACRRAGLVETPPRRAYITNLRIEPNASNGFRLLGGGLVLTEFSKKDFTLKVNAAGQVSVVQINHAS